MRKVFLLLVFTLVNSFAFAGNSTQVKDTLNPSIVKADRSMRSVVKEASKDFSKNYADYYASFLIVRTIKNNGIFREVQCAAGAFASVDFNQKTTTKLYWDDRNAMGRLSVCDSFVSEALFPNKNEVNPTFRVNSKDINNDEDAFKVNYVSEFDVSALDRKRAVEIFSPLNPKMVGDYVYEDGGKAKVGGKNVRVVKFSSKSNKISIKNRIICSGRLYIDAGNNRIRKIVVKDMDYRFTRYCRNFSEMTVVTPYTYTITYGEVDGKIYTAGIKQELRWDLPENHLDKLYCAEFNSCRNPFKNHLETNFTMTFSSPMIINDTQNFGEAYPAYKILGYDKTRDYDFWRRVLAKEIDLGQFMKDTGSTWESLCAQTVSRSERELLSVCGESKVATEKARMEAKKARARELYQKIFNKKYTEGF